MAVGRAAARRSVGEGRRIDKYRCLTTRGELLIRAVPVVAALRTSRTPRSSLQYRRAAPLLRVYDISTTDITPRDIPPPGYNYSDLKQLFLTLFLALARILN